MVEEIVVGKVIPGQRTAQESLDQHVVAFGKGGCQLLDPADGIDTVLFKIGEVSFRHEGSDNFWTYLAIVRYGLNVESQRLSLRRDAVKQAKTPESFLKQLSARIATIA